MNDVECASKNKSFSVGQLKVRGFQDVHFTRRGRFPARLKPWPHRARRVNASRPHRVRDALLHQYILMGVTTPRA